MNPTQSPNSSFFGIRLPGAKGVSLPPKHRPFEIPKHLFRPLFPAPPLFPPFRSGHRVFQWPTPQQRIPVSDSSVVCCHLTNSHMRVSMGMKIMIM